LVNRNSAVHPGHAPAWMRSAMPRLERAGRVTVWSSS
jgi:hypothetical protein